ncbi:hypothetical protein [Phaeobacter sp. 22II1-1F12B]|uniref:hypothetical protein n=1 Tax=Phaeobacter sp. 22II1-1F12B TaxID=1317111 RepID=UPI0026943B28
MDKLKSIFELREMLRQLEKDIGFDDLSRTERDVLLAAHSLSDKPGDVISSEQIRHHNLLQSVAQATFYRAIGTLLGLGLLERAAQTKARSYVVRDDLVGGGFGKDFDIRGALRNRQNGSVASKKANGF